MLAFQRHDLAAGRRFIRDQASRTGLPERRLVDLVLAVNELASPRQNEGHGLWMVTRACDLIELRTGLAGTSVRVYDSLA